MILWVHKDKNNRRGKINKNKSVATQDKTLYSFVTCCVFDVLTQIVYFTPLLGGKWLPNWHIDVLFPFFCSNAPMLYTQLQIIRPIVPHSAFHIVEFLGMKTFFVYVVVGLKHTWASFSVASYCFLHLFVRKKLSCLPNWSINSPFYSLKDMDTNVFGMFYDETYSIPI